MALNSCAAPPLDAGARTPLLRLITDENVPAAVGRFFSARGHHVRLALDLVVAGTPDEALAAIGDKLDAIIVTWDKDFNKLVRQMPTRTKAKFTRLGRITFACPEPLGVVRLQQLIESIEFQYGQCQQREEKRFMVTIGQSHIRFQM